MKVCIKCGIAKEIDSFYIHPQMADDHLGKCKECCKKDERLRRIEHPGKLAAYDKKRNTGERLKQSGIRSKEWRLRNPEKYRAHNILYAAVRDGKLIKPDACEICGSKFHIHAHHADYSKPLEVVWLCARCHGQIQ